jgi:BirA family transcriptional regulator, biotin operon repressor / biotin---[acetyl-CoA-carboxylase] ligase
MLAGFTVEVLPQIDSTNTELLRRLRSAPARLEPLLLVAETQTAGRGRQGRQWQSARGASLTFSLSLPLARADWSGLSLVAGIAIAETLSSHLPAGSAARIDLKWPNDIWLRDAAGERKLGGILVETASWDGARQVVVGVGLNILPLALTADMTKMADAAAPTPGFVAAPPASLSEIDPALDAPGTLQRLLPPLVRALNAFEHAGFAPFGARFAARDALFGRAVKLSDGAEGVARGVGENGALHVHTASGMKEIISSEISVRPVAPAAARPALGLAAC